MDHSPFYWLRRFGSDLLDRWCEDGWRGVQVGVRYYWKAIATWLNKQLIAAIGNPGRPIYEPDWDVLVVLDACRVDLLREVAAEYDFLSVDAIGTFRSRASKSNDWMARNFTPDYAAEMARTAYVTGNPFSRDLDADDFAVFDEVWRYAWDDDLRTIPARPITDRAIATWREREENRTEQMVIHYMQPHVPFVSAPEVGTFGTPEDFGHGFGSVWRDPSFSKARIWPHYRDNLRHVLDDVVVLLDNLDAESVVLTADHGNAVGEFGLWGHPSDLLLPCVRQVPWVEVRGTDTESYEPSIEPPETTDASDSVVSDRLAALGYT